MKLVITIVALVAASVFAFAPMAPVVSRTTSLGYSVRVFNEAHGVDATFDCPSNTYILDAAEEYSDAVLPWSCRAGACSSCLGKVVSGSVDSSDQAFLEPEQIEEGWVLTCMAYPDSDCVIQTHMEDELF